MSGQQTSAEHGVCVSVCLSACLPLCVPVSVCRSVSIREYMFKGYLPACLPAPLSSAAQRSLAKCVTCCSFASLSFWSPPLRHSVRVRCGVRMGHIDRRAIAWGIEMVSEAQIRDGED